MADYSRSIDIPVAPERAFAFVSDVANLPRYVPTTRRAEVQGGHVHVEGVSHGEDYADDGQLYVDTERKVMRWGSGASAYRGELSVADANGGGAHVEIKLHFSEAHGHVPDRGEIEASLDSSLERLHDALTQS